MMGLWRMMVNETENDAYNSTLETLNKIAKPFVLT
jgi:transcriptional regulator with XRE-family HTH domain